MTKLQEKGISLFIKGKLRNALVIFCRFRGLTKNEQQTLEIAKDCMTGSGAFYRALGYDTDKVIKEAKEMIERKWIPVLVSTNT